jgi:hypothetical protein
MSTSFIFIPITSTNFLFHTGYGLSHPIYRHPDLSGGLEADHHVDPRMKRVKMTAYVADRKMNALMAAADLCPPYKVFITSECTMRFRTPTKVNRKYIMKIIAVSKDGDNLWIPAIRWKRKLYVAEGIKELSNGEKVVFVQ